MKTKKKRALFFAESVAECLSGQCESVFKKLKKTGFQRADTELIASGLFKMNAREVLELNKLLLMTSHSISNQAIHLEMYKQKEESKC